MAAPDLRDRLAELEVEHATLLTELEAFHAEYLRRVGVIDVQVQELQARLLAATGPRVDADAAQRRYRESTTALEAVPAPPGPPPSEDLKTLFRDAAKRMHPDLQTDPAGRGHAEAFMKQLNQAYTAGDADAIGNLVRQWETSPYATAAPSGAAPTPALAAAVEQAEQRLEQTRASSLATLMEQTFLASMQGRDLLQELRWNAEEELANVRLRVATLDT
ncbi:hypothetical protein OJ997_06875 [Solirubrobacter phytolaccae]|uniref:J domain-containing protein n=1 Tax=Solirubrobacter phytolaccae TaxID=1404360 RepID=A0A9X3NCC0_9ACTN|nr:hypothetical protein [Solirubrobacter phytolaccae]MDA0180012.1 hypothetical protein [Solirubrobacter phytolaccae]